MVLFTKIVTIDFDLRRKRTILFLFTKILKSILACSICRNSTTVLTLWITMEVCRKNLDRPIFAHVLIVTSVFKHSCTCFSFISLVLMMCGLYYALRLWKPSIHFQFRWFLKDNKFIWDRSKGRVSRKWNLAIEHAPNTFVKGTSDFSYEIPMLKSDEKS